MTDWIAIVVSDKMEAIRLRLFAKYNGYTVPSAHYIPENEPKIFEFYDFGYDKIMIASPAVWNTDLRWPEDGSLIRRHIHNTNREA